MYKERYEKAKSWIEAKRGRMAVFTFVYKLLPVFVFAAYPLVLLYLFISRDERLIKCALVPLFMFVTLSGARYLLNKPRPYEKYDIAPIIPKDTVGKSFPSRHTASAAVIAVTFLYVCPILGAVFAVIALLIAASRIVGGVHFPRDVIAGIVYALICGTVLWFI